MTKAVSVVLDEIPEPTTTGDHAAARVTFGKTFPPQQQILLYSAGEWEEFIHEWVHSQHGNYKKVSRFAGANDMGIDIAGLSDDDGIFGQWDNFQCKHYNDPLTPARTMVEIGKVLWHSFNKSYKPPRKYYFIAPKDCGIKLNKILSDPAQLKNYLFDKWDEYCKAAITSTQQVKLTGQFKKYANAFDYSIFTSRPCLEIIDEHRTTAWYSIRFGGGLPERPSVSPPPTEVMSTESRYLTQLFEVYSDYKGTAVTDLASLSPWTDLADHYHRQRETFYHAEALRNFARDTVPPGTFEDLQNEMHSGVVEVATADHNSAYVRLNAVTQAATNLQLTSNALISVVKVQDRKGMCHQLANEDRLTWKKT